MLFCQFFDFVLLNFDLGLVEIFMYHKNREKNLQFYGVMQSKIRWMDLEIKFIKDNFFCLKLKLVLFCQFFDFALVNFDLGLVEIFMYQKNREKNLQFYGVKQSKIRWMDLEIKFIKRKNFNENWQPQNQYIDFKNLAKIIKIEKKIAILWCKAIKNQMDRS